MRHREDFDQQTLLGSSSLSISHLVPTKLVINGDSSLPGAGPLPPILVS